MRSTKAFILGLGTAFLADRAVARRRRHESGPVNVNVSDETIEHRVLGDALPAAGVSTHDVEVDVEDGVVTLQGAVAGANRADELVQQVAKVPGVRDVAAMLRVTERRAA
ncbi:MAG TPA: BON domain-containing protein [Gaiellaceae bacterium]|nr:BON domain-containing protein [Gaiellaceae bacterium]